MNLFKMDPETYVDDRMAIANNVQSAIISNSFNIQKSRKAIAKIAFLFFILVLKKL